MEHQFFESLLAIMVIALISTVVLQRLRLPNIVAYLLAGVLIGPHMMAWVERPDEFSFLAEFGVVFLLFSLGLEFSLGKLIALRASVFGLGGIQVAFCTLFFGGAVWLWGTNLEATIVIAGALALSSTAIVTKELSGLRQVHTRHGQLSVGILLFQDLAAVIFLILVPVLAGTGQEPLLSALGLALLKGLLLVVILLSVGKYVLPHLYKEVARAQSEEVFVLSTLVIVMLAAWVTHSFGLSMALGGFVIGMMLGESHFRHQINSDIRAFKDILLGLFFVTIGMNVQVSLLLEYWPRILLFSFALVTIKALLIGLLVCLLGDSKNNAVKTALNLAQAGEFGLALLALGSMQGLLDPEQASFIILVAIFSMVASPFLIRHSDKIGNLIFGFSNAKKDQINQSKIQLSLPNQNHVIIGGFGRVGQTIARLMDSNDIDYIAIDHNINLISEQRQLDKNVIYGDCTNMKMLHSCHIESARMAILTFSSIELAKNTIEHIRACDVTIPIIVRCCEHGDFNELISLGADYVVPEMLEACLVVGTQALSLLEVAEKDIERQIQEERNKQLKH